AYCQQGPEVPRELLPLRPAEPAGRPPAPPALQRQRWTPVTRVFLTVGRRFWGPGRPALLAASDRPAVRWMPGPEPAGEGEILTAYVVGEAARELASLTPEGRAAWARAEAARAFPEWAEAASAEALSHCWDQDPFAGGGSYSGPPPATTLCRGPSRPRK